MSEKRDTERACAEREYVDRQVAHLRELWERELAAKTVAMALEVENQKERTKELDAHLERLNNSFARADEALKESVRVDVFTIQMQVMDNKYQDMQTTIRVIGMGTAALVLSAVVAVAGWLLRN